MKKKTPKKVASKSDYTVAVKILGRIFTAKGATVLEALSKVDVGRARGKSIVMVSHGETTKERILSMMQSNRLFNTAGLTQEIARKQISSMFDGI